MSNDYTKFGKHNNYNNRFNQEQHNDVDENADSAEVILENETKNLTDNETLTVNNVNNLNEGIITNCKKLNIREKAFKDAKIIEVVDVDTKVLVDKKQSTNIFYKVVTNSGTEGFAMRNFVKLK